MRDSYANTEVMMLRFELPNEAKGWFVGPWNSDVPIPIGYANEGIDIHHYHEQMNEIYLVARGTATGLINGQHVQLSAGDCLVVEPGERHTFIDNSDDYLVFVVQAPFVKDDKVTVNDAAN